MGKVTLKKDHILCKGTTQVGISERMHGLMCLLGQSMVFQGASETFQELLHLDISAPQIQRVCIHYGGSTTSRNIENNFGEGRNQGNDKTILY